MNNNNVIYANKRKKGEEKPITKLYDIIVTHNAEEPDYFRLDEVPLRYIKNVIKCDATGAETNIILQEQIGGTPTTGKFVVNYDMGTIYVNDADNVRKIKVSYLGTGSVLLASDVNELNKVHENYQEKLTPAGSIVIDEDEYYWSNFAEDRYLYITQAIPSFTKLNIVFEASLTSKDEDNSTLMCQGYITEQNTNQAEEKLIGLQVNTTKPGLYSNNQWILGHLDAELREKYFYCIHSDDGQTFTIYSLKKDNYDLYNLPSFEFWNEECTFTEDIFTNQNFYIGYNQFTPSEYFHGRIFGCLITLDDEVFFDLNRSQIGVDYINNNCTYTGEIENPTILSPELKSGTNINLLNTENKTYINFKGSHYIVKAVYDEEIEDEKTLIISEPISESTCIFLNGQLLTYGLDYTYEVLENPENDKPKIKLIFSRIIDHKIVLPDPDSEPIDIMDSSIFIIPGLSYKYLGELTGNDIYVGRNIQQNTLVFRNGILQYQASDLSLETGYTVIDGRTLRFNTGKGTGDLDHDDISIIFNYNNKLSVRLTEPTNSYDFGLNLPDNTLIFRNGQLIGQYVDWDKERDDNGNYTNNNTIKFTSIYNTNEWLVASIQPSDAIYNAIGDKQDRLPELIQNKILGTDGNQIMWVDPNFGTIDYSKIVNKPTINNIIIDGDKTAEEYGLQDQIPFTTSDAYKLLSNDGTDLTWMEIDDELKSNSANPVQNAVVKNALDTKQNNITGAAETITTNNLATSKAVISNASGKIDVSDTTSTELGYVHGVTSAIQTQLDNKQATITGALENITNTTLTANRALKSDANGKVTTSNVTTTELEYLSGVTSGIQDQINSKQNKISSGTANNIIAFSGTAGTLNSLDRVTTIADSTNASDLAIPTEKAVRTELDKKQDEITNDNKLDADLVDGLANVATSGDYNDLGSKPSINGYEIVGNKTAKDYGILVGNNLFDMKIKQDANPDKNWVCISNREVILNEDNAPTVYKEIQNRYRNIDLNTNNSYIYNSTITNSSVKFLPTESGFDIFLFKKESNIIGLYQSDQDELENSTFYNVFNLPEYNDNTISNIQFIDSCYGDNYLLIRTKYTQNATTKNALHLYEINEDHEFTLTQSFEIGDIIPSGYNKISYLDSEKMFVFTQVAEANSTYNIDLYKLDLAELVTSKIANIEYDMKNVMLIEGNTFFFGYNDSLYSSTSINDLTEYTELVQHCDGNYVKIMNTIMTEGPKGVSSISYDNGLTWNINDLGDDTYYYRYKLTQINDNEVIVKIDYYNGATYYHSKIYRTADLINFYLISDNFTIEDKDNLDFYDSNLVFTVGTNYYLIQYTGKIYQQTYIINNTTYTIDYVVSMISRTKIIYEEHFEDHILENTLDALFNYYGYLDYFVISGSGKIVLPRTKILWTYMYVGDNYVDNSIPTGNYTPIEVQINKTNDYTSNSEVTYPSSKALKDGLQSMIPTITWYDTTHGDFQANDTEIQTDLDNIIKVYNNGLLLRVSTDYTTSLVNNKVKITFTTALLGTDQIAVESL